MSQSLQMELSGQLALMPSYECVEPSQPPEHGLVAIGHGQEDIPGESLAEVERKELPGAKRSDVEWMKMTNHGLEDRHFADLSPKARRRLAPYFVRSDDNWIKLDSWLHTAYNDRHNPRLFCVPSKGKKDEIWIPVSGAEAIILGLEYPTMVGSTAVGLALQTEFDLNIFGALAHPPTPRWQVIDAYLRQRIEVKRKWVSDLYDTMRLGDSNGEHMQGKERLELARKVRTEVLHPIIQTVGEYRGWDRTQGPITTRQALQVLDFSMLHEGAGNQKFRQIMTIKPVFKEVGRYLEDLAAVFEERKAFAKKNPKHPAFRRITELALQATLERYPRVQ